MGCVCFCNLWFVRRTVFEVSTRLLYDASVSETERETADICHFHKVNMAKNCIFGFIIIRTDDSWKSNFVSCHIGRAQAGKNQVVIVTDNSTKWIPSFALSAPFSSYGSVGGGVEAYACVCVQPTTWMLAVVSVTSYLYRTSGATIWWYWIDSSTYVTFLRKAKIPRVDKRLFPI